MACSPQADKPDPHTTSPASPASPWVLRFAPLVPRGVAVLDLAAGGGRHSRLFLERGHPVLAVDRDVSALTPLARYSAFRALAADLEDGRPFPLAGQHFAGVVVTNYLYRPILAAVIDAVALGGLLIYETFAVGNEAFGKPSNPAFLLRHGELLEAVRGRLRVVAYEDRIIAEPRPAVVQRIAAVRDGEIPDAGEGT